MASNPKRMVRKVEELEQQAVRLSMEMFVTIPAVYRERPTADAVCVAWTKALDAATWVEIALEELGNLLRTKAGINRLSPFEELRAEMEAGEKPPIVEPGEREIPFEGPGDADSPCARARARGTTLQPAPSRAT